MKTIKKLKNLQLTTDDLSKLKGGIVEHGISMYSDVDKNKAYQCTCAPGGNNKNKSTGCSCK